MTPAGNKPLRGAYADSYHASRATPGNRPKGMVALLASSPEKPPKGFLSLGQERTSHGLTPSPGRQANHPNRRLRVLLSSLRAPNTQREPERNTIRHAKPDIRTVETLVVVILLHCEDSM